VIGYAVAFKNSGRIRATNITESFNPAPYNMPDGTTHNPSPTERVIVADATLSNGENELNRNLNSYTGIDGGWRGHQAAHLGPQKIPVGGNLLYLDGHTEWQRFEAMRVRTTGTPPFWW
jgi:prepilin-type processing-associated H-X9-DG protein